MPELSAMVEPPRKTDKENDGVCTIQTVAKFFRFIELSLEICPSLVRIS